MPMNVPDTSAGCKFRQSRVRLHSVCLCMRAFFKQMPVVSSLELALLEMCLGVCVFPRCTDPTSCTPLCRAKISASFEFQQPLISSLACPSFSPFDYSIGTSEQTFV